MSFSNCGKGSLFTIDIFSMYLLCCVYIQDAFATVSFGFVIWCSAGCGYSCLVSNREMCLYPTLSAGFAGDDRKRGIHYSHSGVGSGRPCPALPFFLLSSHCRC